MKLDCGREPDEYALPCHRPDRARSSYWSDLLQTRRCQGSPASAGPDVAIADNESLAPQQRYGTESDMADDFSFQTSSVRTMYRSRHRCTAGTATYLQLRLTAYTAAGGPELPKCRVRVIRVYSQYLGCFRHYLASFRPALRAQCQRSYKRLRRDPARMMDCVVTIALATRCATATRTMLPQVRGCCHTVARLAIPAAESVVG